MNTNEYFEYIEKSNVELETCIKHFLNTNKVNDYNSITDYISHLSKYLKKNRFDGELIFEKKYSFIVKAPELTLEIVKDEMSIAYHFISTDENKNIIPQHFEYLKILRDTNLIFDHNNKHEVYKKEESLPCFFDIQLKSIELKSSKDFDIQYINYLSRESDDLVKNSKSFTINKTNLTDSQKLIIHIAENTFSVTNHNVSNNTYSKFLNYLETNKNLHLVDFINKECGIDFINVLIEQKFKQHPKYKEKVDFEIITEDHSATKDIVEQLCGMLEGVSYQIKERPLNYSEKLINKIKKRLSL